MVLLSFCLAIDSVEFFMKRELELKTRDDFVRVPTLFAVGQDIHFFNLNILAPFSASLHLNCVTVNFTIAQFPGYILTNIISSL